MNIKKINYSINRSYKLFLSNKNNYQRIVKHLRTFYKEGINDKNYALELRNNAIKSARYLNRFNKQRESICNTFLDYCNSTKLLKKLFNLE